MSKDAIVTKTADGGLAIAVWNLVDPDKHGSDAQRHTGVCAHVTPDAQVCD